MEERKYVLTESQLQNLLTDSMKLDMLESYGVDNWSGYGCNRDETKAYFYPGDWNELDADTKFDTSFWDIAGMRIEAGEFCELSNIVIE
jgi:hypothetical protein